MCVGFGGGGFTLSQFGQDMKAYKFPRQGIRGDRELLPRERGLACRRPEVCGIETLECSMHRWSPKRDRAGLGFEFANICIRKKTKNNLTTRQTRNVKMRNRPTIGVIMINKLRRKVSIEGN